MLPVSLAASLVAATALVSCGGGSGGGGGPPPINIPSGNPAKKPAPANSKANPTGVWIVRTKRRPQDGPSDGPPGFYFENGDTVTIVAVGPSSALLKVTRSQTGGDTGLTRQALEASFGTRIPWHQNTATDTSVEFSFAYHNPAVSPSFLHYGIRLSATSSDTFSGFEREKLINGSTSDTSTEIEFRRRTSVPSFSGTPGEISIGQREQQALFLNAGQAQAHRLYWILGSLTGTSPGVKIGSVTIPLVPDVYTQITLMNSSTSYVNFREFLDPLGNAVADFDATGIPSSAVGVTLFHAYVVFDSANDVVFASNPVSVKLLR
jgi:hypothetical protein